MLLYGYSFLEGISTMLAWGEQLDLLGEI